MIVFGVAQLAAAYAGGRVAGPKYVESRWKYSATWGVGGSALVVLISWLTPALVGYIQYHSNVMWVVLYEAPLWMAAFVACVMFGRRLAGSGVVPVETMRLTLAVEHQPEST